MYINQITADAVHDTHTSELGALLKASMAKQQVSMRGLSKLTGIGTATISRIITGKQAASLHHLQEFAKHLNLSIEVSLNSIGVSYMEHPSNGQSIPLSMIGEVFSDCRIDLGAVTTDILKELDKLELYARTKEGRKTIADGFEAKMKVVDGAGAFIDKLNKFYKLFCSDGISEEKKAVIGSALLYFSLTIGVIPDYLFPIGYLDDAIAVKIVEAKLSQMKD